MNKFLILIAAFLLTIQFSNAQTATGSQTIGLNCTFSILQSNSFNISPGNNSTSTLNSKITYLSIGPQYSYFIADKLEVGANLSYGSYLTTYNSLDIATTNDGSPVRDISNSYGGNVFIRKYFMYKNKIGFRTGVFLGYTYETQKDTYSPANADFDDYSKSNNFSGGAQLDLVYYPSKKLGIAANIVNLDYEHYKQNNAAQGYNSGNDLTFNFVNQSLSLSVFYVFGDK